MKATRLLLVFAAALSIASCNNKTNENGTDAVEQESLLVEDATAIDSTATSQKTSEGSAVITLGAEDFPLPASRPAVIDFSATWCGPCREFKPIYHAVAEEYANKADFYTADVDECTKLAQKYNVQSIPFILILKAGSEPVSQIGNMTEKEFKALLDKSL